MDHFRLPSSPPTAGSSNGLPSYLSRYINIGWDDDDVSALLDSIASSQAKQARSQLQHNSAPGLPYLPPEILLQILLAVPPAYILPFRLVSRAFRELVETYVFYSYIVRTRLFIKWTTKQLEMMEAPNEPDPTAVFHGLVTDATPEMERVGPTHRERGPAKWDGRLARFKVDDVNSCPGLFKKIESYDERESVLRGLLYIGLDEIVNDTDLPGVQADVDSLTIIFDWRGMLWSLLKEEHAIRQKLEETVDSEYRYSHGEDCLRYVRRQRIKQKLDPADANHRQIEWCINNQEPLFTLMMYPARKIGPASIQVVGSEDICEPINVLRRQFALTERQKKELAYLSRTRNEILNQLSELQSTVRSYCHACSGRKDRKEHREYLRCDSNPVKWTARQHELELARIEDWQTQREIVARVIEDLQTGMEILRANRAFRENPPTSDMEFDEDG